MDKIVQTAREDPVIPEGAAQVVSDGTSTAFLFLTPKS